MRERIPAAVGLASARAPHPSCAVRTYARGYLTHTPRAQGGGVVDREPGGRAEVGLLARQRPEASPRAPSRAEAGRPGADDPKARAQVLRRDLRFSTIDGTAYCVMVGCGELFLAPFALLWGGQNAELHAALITTVPVLIGAMLQLIAPLAVGWFGEYRAWIVAAASLQAASFVPLAIMAAIGWAPAWAVYAAAAIYFGTNLACAASWNAWITRIVPRAIRPNYFARRAAICYAGVVAGLIGAGIALHLARQSGDMETEWRVFAAVFAAAAAARAVSTVYLALYSNAAPVGSEHRVLGLRELFRRLVRPSPQASRGGTDGGGRIIVLFTLAVAGFHVALPMLAPFAFVALKFGYLEFLALMAAPFIARALTQRRVGLLTARRGPRPVLWAALATLIPIPGLWLAAGWIETSAGFGAALAWMLAVQLLMGVAMGAYELAFMLLTFEHMPEDERASLMVAFNVGQSLAMVGGTIAGTGLFWALGGGWAGYAAVFGAGVAARAAVLAFGLLRGLERTQVPPPALPGHQPGV